MKSEKKPLDTLPMEPAKFNLSEIQMIIHEIRSPLSAIGMANHNLMSIEIPDKSSKLLLEIIDKNISRIDCLLRGLLQKTDGQPLELFPIDLCNVLEESLQKADDRIALKEVQVIKSYGFNFFVNGDAQSLAIAFSNIIINAIESMKTRGKLWITVYQANDEIKVSFRDNGAGMDPGVLAQVFDKKYSHKPGGSGMGLWIVKNIIDHHNAQITVFSEVNKGTIVTVSLTTNGNAGF